MQLDNPTRDMVSKQKPQKKDPAAPEEVEFRGELPKYQQEKDAQLNRRVATTSRLLAGGAPDSPYQRTDSLLLTTMSEQVETIARKFVNLDKRQRVQTSKITELEAMAETQKNKITSLEEDLKASEEDREALRREVHRIMEATDEINAKMMDIS